MYARMYGQYNYDGNVCKKYFTIWQMNIRAGGKRVGLGRIRFLLPDAGYPAGLSGIPCQILLDNRLSGRINRHCRIFGPTL